MFFLIMFKFLFGGIFKIFNHFKAPISEILRLLFNKECPKKNTAYLEKLEKK